MASATFVPDIAIGLAQTMGASLERAEELSHSDIPTAISICWFLRSLFANARTSIESELCDGVDARAFIAKHEIVVRDVDTSAANVAQLIKRIKVGQLGTRSEALVTHLEGLHSEITSLKTFLVEALAKAKTPMPAIDLKRVEAAKAAFERGETKPFSPALTRQI